MTGAERTSELGAGPPTKKERGAEGRGGPGGGGIATALGDVHVQYVWRFLRAQKIDPAARKSWCQSNDPEFAAKAAEIVGLYLDPPENGGAGVGCWRSMRAVDPARERGGYQGGHPQYTRHGTTTLSAAFDVATGKVTGRHYARRRRVEFLDFMNRLVDRHPGREIHVILDNLNTHKPKNDRWLKRHPNVRFHFTPTAASWLNQVEIWFSILAGKSLHGASFNSLAKLKQHIEDFISAYNETARPFQWTASQVHQKRLKAGFADQ